jgi:hypothetical protein
MLPSCYGGTLSVNPPEFTQRSYMATNLPVQRSRRSATQEVSTSLADPLCDLGRSQKPRNRECASERRNKELNELTNEGLPIVPISKWQCRIGPLHIWPHSGRWLNEATGWRGRINSLSMRVLITREVSDVAALEAESRNYTDKSGKRLISERPRRRLENKLEYLETKCQCALRIYMAEAEKLCELLRRFKEGERTAPDQERLRGQWDRENEAHANYRRARGRLLHAAKLSCR